MKTFTKINFAYSSPKWISCSYAKAQRNTEYPTLFKQIDTNFLIIIIIKKKKKKKKKNGRGLRKQYTGFDLQ